jgi:membrane protein YqaA with SNARE-associated domain
MANPTVPASGQADASGPQPRWAGRLRGMPGIVLAFFWGFAEGTFFFVVPDVAISLAAMLEPRRVWRHILAAIAGSVVAGMVLFSWSARDPEGAHKAVAQVPFVTARMFVHVQTDFRVHGMTAIFLGPMSGLPYKLYAVEAPDFVGRNAFLLSTVPARAVRFLIVWGGFGVAGIFLRKSRKWTASQLTTLHGSCWALFYAFYWGMIAFR